MADLSALRDTVSVIAGFATIIGLPVAIYTIVRQARQVRADLAGRSQLRIDVPSGGGVVAASHDPGTGPIDCAVDPQHPDHPGLVTLTIRTTNDGTRTARNLLWNYVCPEDIMTPDTLQVVKPDTKGIIITHEESLNPAVSNEVSLQLRCPPKGESRDVVVFLTQEDQPARQTTIRLTNPS